jgi:hypothetical protein
VVPEQGIAPFAFVDRRCLLEGSLAVKAAFCDRPIWPNDDIYHSPKGLFPLSGGLEAAKLKQQPRTAVLRKTGVKQIAELMSRRSLSLVFA